MRENRDQQRIVENLLVGKVYKGARKVSHVQCVKILRLLVDQVCGSKMSKVYMDEYGKVNYECSVVAASSFGIKQWG